MSNNHTNPNQFFSWRFAVVRSILPATTKHVLLTLSIHMNDLGEGCFPSTVTLAKETSLSERSVITHIMLAVNHGWIRKQIHGYSGRGWKHHEYVLKWPEGTERPSVPKLQGTECPSNKALKEVQSNSTVITLE